LTNNVIVAGFDGELGDRGTHILLNRIKEGDLIFAYANGYGYVGVGLAINSGTYKLCEENELPLGYLSNNTHHRGIRWLYYVESLNDAIREFDFFPRQTEQHIKNENAEKLLRAFWQNPKTVIRF